jgi:hypothetical protein
MMDKVRKPVILSRLVLFCQEFSLQITSSTECSVDVAFWIIAPCGTKKATRASGNKPCSWEHDQLASCLANTSALNMEVIFPSE